MGPSNKAICFWFVAMLLSGMGMLKDTYGQPKMLVAVTVLGFVCSAWFFMDGLLSALRPAKPQSKLTSDIDTTIANG